MSQAKQKRQIDWPAELDRTDPAGRDRTTKFDVSLSKALDGLEREMERLEVDDYRLSTGARQRKQDNRPYARSNPDDPGIVIRWSKDGEQFAIGCDCWATLRDNTRELGLHIREKRKMEQRPVASAQSEFATARLPPVDEDAIAAPPAPSSDDLDAESHEVLDVAPDAPNDVVETVFRKKVQSAHPDKGGSRAAFNRLQKAKEAMING